MATPALYRGYVSQHELLINIHIFSICQRCSANVTQFLFGELFRDEEEQVRLPTILFQMALIRPQF